MIKYTEVKMAKENPTAPLYDNRKIIIYTRQSREKEGSISHETQVDVCKKYVELMMNSTNNIEIIHEDKNMSGAKFDRPQLQKLIKMVKSNQVKAIVVYKLDRLSRSLRDFLELMEIFSANNVEFISTQEKFDTTTEIGKLCFKILMLFAEFERNTTIARVSDAYKSRSQKGYYMGGRLPYGFGITDDMIDGNKTSRYVINEAQMEQVKELYKTYALEQFSLRRVLKHMSNSPDLVGAGWTTSKISTILKNPIYAIADMKLYDYFMSKGYVLGEYTRIEDFDGTRASIVYTYNDGSSPVVVILKHPGVIAADTWIKCNKKLEKNNQIGNAVSNKTSWLGGILKCQKCGHTMTTIKGKADKKGRIRRYFNCLGRSEKRNCSGPKGTIYADIIESLVAGEISKKLATLKTTRRILSDENQRKFDEYNRQIKAIETKIDALCDAFTSEDFDAIQSVAFKERISRLQTEKNSLEQERDNIMQKDAILTESIDLNEKWKHADMETRRHVAKTLIEVIIIHADSTAEIVWKL